MANGLKNLSGKISNVLDLIIKHAGDIVKFEKEAVEASKKMEEASIQAQIARTNMITVIFGFFTKFLCYKIFLTRI